MHTIKLLPTLACAQSQGCSGMWQEFVPPDREVLTRNAFRRTALETRCQLFFPAPDDDIVLLRTGFLKHIQVQC